MKRNYLVLAMALLWIFGLSAMKSDILVKDESGVELIGRNWPLEEIVEQFLHKPKEFKQVWGGLPKDLSRILAQMLLRKAYLSLLAQVPIPSKVMYKGETEGDVSAVFNAAGDRVLVLSQDNLRAGRDRLLACKDGRCIAVLGRHSRFSEDGNVVVSCLPRRDAAFGALVLHDTQSGKELARITVNAYLNSLSFSISKTGDTILITYCGNWYVCSVNKGTIEVRARGKHEGEDALTFTGALNHKGSRFVTGAKSLKMWDAETGTFLFDMIDGMDDYGPFIATFSADDTRVLIAKVGPEGKLFDAITGECLARYTCNEKVSGNLLPAKVSFNKKSNKVIIAHNGVNILDVSTGLCLCTISKGNSAVVITSGELVISSYKVAEESGEVIYVTIWDTQTGECLKELLKRKKQQRRSFLHIFDHNPDAAYMCLNSLGNNLLTAIEDEVVEWDLTGFLERKRLLSKDIRFEQAVLLYCIFEVVKARALVKEHRAERVFEEGAQVLSKEELVFDFDKYPHLKEVYALLPDSIRLFLNGYVRGVK